jgi:hypothetical protein
VKVVLGMGIRGIVRQACAMAILVGCLLPAAAAAGPARGVLSPLLTELATEEVRSLPPGRQAELLGVAPTGPGSLLRDEGRVLVRVRFDHGALASIDALRAAGGRVVGASRAYQSATVAVAAADLRKLARVKTVAAVSPVRAPVLRAVDCEGGSQISEGVAQLNVKAARDEFVVDGTGITVGVLSDSYDRDPEVVTDAETDVETADLPGTGNECSGQMTPIDVIEDLAAPGSDEGRAMLQIVHDVAPQADLAFATAFEGEEEFAKNIEELADAGAEVIVDDVAYFEEPFFQDGPVANAITEVTEEGVSYLSATGNDNLFDGEGNEISSWEAPAYRDSGGCPPEVESLSEFNAFHCMDFNPGAATDRTFGIKVDQGETLTVDLQWAEPWAGVDTDLDAFLLDADGELIGAEAGDNLATQLPVEIIQWENESAATQTVQLVVNRFTGPGARLKFILLQNGGGVSGTEYPRSGGGDVVGPAVYGHAGAESAIAVAAVPFNNGNKPEPYSSRGPATHYFEAFKGPVPADPLPTPEVVSKPDVAATDCGRTTFFASFSAGVWRFCGTSAAAPHAAGVVALMREAAPLADAGLLRESLVGTGASVGAFGSCAVGGGLVEALAAVEAAREEITPAEPQACDPPNPSGEVFVAPGDWGSEAPAPNPLPDPVPPSRSEPPPPSTPLPPVTRFVRTPPKVVRTARAGVRVVLRFAADQPGATFLCKIDRTAYRPCGARVVRRFGLGRHVVRVRAVGASGLLDPTPLVFRFRVKRI